MRMKITTLTFTLVFLALFLSSSGQAQQENYYIITLKGSIIKNALSLPGFSYFDFTFKPVGNNSYSLEGYAKDANDKRIGALITFSTMNEKMRALKNLQKGYLRLTLDDMQTNNVDGSEDYVLTPKKTKDKSSGNPIDYVSYRFSNKIEATLTGLLSLNLVRSFDLNPSPPY